MRIFWERFFEPLAEMGKYPRPDESDDEGYGADREAILSEYESEEAGKYNRPKVYDGPLVITSVGIMGTSQRSLASNKYSIWIGRTKRDITAQHIRDIQTCHGVEILQPITRYSFLFATGPQFNDREVRTGIEEALSDSHDDNPQSRIDILRRGATISYGNRWAIMESPEGHLELVGGKTSIEVDDKISKYGELWKVLERPAHAKKNDSRGERNS